MFKFCFDVGEAMRLCGEDPWKWEQEVRYPIQRCLEALGYRNLGEGWSRVTYERGNFVVKVPKSFARLAENLAEYQNCLDRAKHGIPVARCRLSKCGILLVMQKVRPTSDCPEWADAVDCWQIGVTSKGKTVAYDYPTLYDTLGQRVYSPDVGLPVHEFGR